MTQATEAARAGGEPTVHTFLVLIVLAGTQLPVVLDAVFTTRINDVLGAPDRAVTAAALTCGCSGGLLVGSAFAVAGLIVAALRIRGGKAAVQAVPPLMA